MEKVTTSGKELRYWNPARTVVTDAGETKAPDWVKKPVDVVVDLPTDISEVLERGEADVLNLVREALTNRAKKAAGSVPTGCISKAMASAITKALGSAPQFSKMERAEKRDAVLKFVSSNEAILAGFLAAFAAAPVEDEDSDEEES